MLVQFVNINLDLFPTLFQYSLDGVNYVNYGAPVSVNEGDSIWVKLQGEYHDPVIPQCTDCDSVVHTAMNSYLYTGVFIVPDHDVSIELSPYPDFGIIDCCPNPCISFDDYPPQITTYVDFCKMKAFGFVTSTLPDYTEVEWYLVKGTDETLIGTGLFTQVECQTGDFKLKAVFKQYNNLNDEASCGCAVVPRQLCQTYETEQNVFVPDIRPQLGYTISPSCADCEDCLDCVVSEFNVPQITMLFSITDYFIQHPEFFAAYTQNGLPYQVCDPPFGVFLTVSKKITNPTNGIVTTYYAKAAVLGSPVLNNLDITSYLIPAPSLPIDLSDTSPALPTPEDVFGAWDIEICYNNCCVPQCCKKAQVFVESPIRIEQVTCNSFVIKKCVDNESLCYVQTTIHKVVNGKDTIVQPAQAYPNFPITIETDGDGIYYAEIIEYAPNPDCEQPKVLSVYAIPFVSFCDITECIAQFTSKFICIPDCEVCKNKAETNFRNAGYEISLLFAWFIMLQKKLAFESRYKIAIDENDWLTINDTSTILAKIQSICTNCLNIVTNCGCNK